MKKYILAIDQGTSSTKTIIFDELGQAVCKGSVDLKTNYFDNGFVEQNPEDIYQNVLDSVRLCLNNFSNQGFKLDDIASCGISNQRETFVLWDKDGKTLAPAVVWACKRSIAICTDLIEKGQNDFIKQKTGLLLDPYFSGTKLLWLLQNDAALKEKVEKGEVYFGTVDCWLLYKLSNGKHFKTDYTNASRTLLFNIHSLEWDAEILGKWGLSNLKLPLACPSSYDFGEFDLKQILNDNSVTSIPITALIGDSHAATFGEGCFEKGTAKVTLGTGSSIMMNIGGEAVLSDSGMLTTICWSTKDRVDYALEGAIVSCGSTIEWLKNELQLFSDVRETAAMATAIADNAGVYLIPAFSGLGAPHWQMSRKASIEGMTFGTTKNHIVRAALESIPYQIKDVVEAMAKDMKAPLKSISVNGGMTQNKFVIHFLADLLGIPLNKQQNSDVSALGAAYLSGLKSGVYKDIEQLSGLVKSQTEQVLSDSNNELPANGYLGWKEKINKEIV
ncbi:FGGY family carbohydrate kinase [Flavobacterium foetidum]|uniref:FGGY family carbohydrate kinase n=1 Tax=Flavobacterium foetidum TaxID=2026681 RepID=UPI00107518C4|nr:glycerol kinase GlpK [Flavobacterium foetidum]KAF2515673.1 glycerol kinase GlpK [Flavobacterium foetidum]